MVPLGILLIFGFVLPSHAVPNSTDRPVAAEKEAESKLFPMQEFWALTNAMLETELDDMRTEIAKEFNTVLQDAGPPEPGWSESGIDIDAFMRELPGGNKQNALLHTGEFPILELLGGVPPELLKDWQLVAKGESSSKPDASKAGYFTAISPRHVAFFPDGDIKQINHAYCFTGNSGDVGDYARIYRDSRFSFDPDDEGDIEFEAQAIVFFQIFSAIRIHDICSVYRRVSENSVRSLAYTADGRPLDGLNEDPDIAIAVQDFDLRRQLTEKFDSALFEDLLEDQSSE